MTPREFLLIVLVFIATSLLSGCVGYVVGAYS